MSLLAREVVSSNVVNDQDHGAYATIASAFALTTIGIFFCIRLLIRWPWQSLFGKDDVAVAIASVSTLAAFTTVLLRFVSGKSQGYAHARNLGTA